MKRYFINSIMTSVGMIFGYGLNIKGIMVHPMALILYGIILALIIVDINEDLKDE